MNKVVKIVSLGLLLGAPFMYAMEGREVPVERTSSGPSLLGMPDEALVRILAHIGKGPTVKECLKSLLRLRIVNRELYNLVSDDEIVRVIQANFSPQDLQDEFLLAVQDGDDYDFVKGFTCLEKNGLKLIDVNAKDEDGDIFLITAVLNNHIDVARALIAAGANVNEPSNHGVTSLMFAAHRGLIEMVTLLLENQALVNAQDGEGDTALIWAVKNSNTFQQKCVEQLIAAGAIVTMPNNHGMTALMWAALSGISGAIELLIQHDVDINSQDYIGWTALMNAAQEGHLNVVALLLHHHADVDLQNDDGETALDIAIAEGGRAEIINLLREAGAQG